MPEPMRHSFNTAHFSQVLEADAEERESSHTEQSGVTDQYGQEEDGVTDGQKVTPFAR